MPHYPKPFYRPKKARWYVQLDGKQINLGPDEQEAFKSYYALMAARSQSPLPIAKPPSDEVRLVEIFDDYMQWCHQHREGRTANTNQERLTSFVEHLADKHMLVASLKPYHVQTWVDSHGKDWSPTTQRGRIQVVQRALNWAAQQGLIEKSPIAHMKKPSAGKRDNVISQDVYLRMRELTATDEFRDLIDVAWETGCRPQEIWRVEARHLDTAASRWVFPAKESKGKKKIRVVYLTAASMAICDRLAKTNVQGPLFLNSEGEPWTRFAVACVFARMKKHLDKRYAFVDFRHTFVTRALMNGVDPVTLAFLLGHADTSMLAKTYAHLGQESGHLFDALNKASPKHENT